MTVNWNISVPYIVDDWLQVYNSGTINIGQNVVVKFKRSVPGSNGALQNVNLRDSHTHFVQRR